MDFSKVKLADFSRAKLRDVAISTSEIKPVENHSEPSIISCAHAPQYTVSALHIIPEVASKEIRSLDTSLETGHCLAVTEDELVVWKLQTGSKLAFGLSQNHQVSARFVHGTNQQPEMVIIDLVYGKITHFDSINRAILSADTNLASGCVGQIPLSGEEKVDHIEVVAQVGLVVSTNWGHFYLINLRNELGKQQVTVISMRHGSGLLARLRSLGTFTRDVTSIKCGRLSDRVQEVLVANVYGDITVWRVGSNGFHELANEVHVGPKLNAHMDLLYPNSGITMVVHDLAVDDENTHILASFAPSSSSAKRNLVVLSLNLDYDVVSVRRLQAYEKDGVISSASLHINNSVLVAVCEDAIVMVDTPSRAVGTMPVRWEECLFFKSNVKVLGSKTEYEKLTIDTASELLQLELSTQRTDKSTTKTRLEQAVFESSPQNPLNLTKWSSFEAYPDKGAATELAHEIADSQTPFVPAKLPDLATHLDLRLSKLLALFEIVRSTEVRDIAQSLVTASVLYSAYAVYSKEIDACLARLKPGISLESVLMHNTELAPELLNSLIKSGGDGTIFLTVLQACDAKNLGVPSWVTNESFRGSLELLNSRAEDSKDLPQLEVAVKMLCAVYASQNCADCAVSHDSLMKLANLGSSKAIEIAYQYKIWSVLAPLEVNQWIQSGSPELVVAHISELGSSFSDHVFDTCITSGHSLELLKILAPIFPDAVRDYFAANKLYNIAWTLEPTSGESTEQLALATTSATSLKETRLYASLYKISAHFTGSGDKSQAQTYLDLVAAQETLSRQYTSASSVPVVVQRGLRSMQNGKLLAADTAVELLALAPPQAVPESNDNFVLGFKLLKSSDIIRKRLLVQQLIVNTNWDRVISGANSSMRRIKETLYYQTLQNLASSNIEVLRDFRSSVVLPERDVIRKVYSWDLNDSVYHDYTEVAQKALNIADKYDVDDLVSQMF